MLLKTLKLNSKHDILLTLSAYAMYTPSQLDYIWVNARRKFWISRLMGSKDVRYDKKLVI